jgi:putative CocE/NonD family hydrolase
MASQPWSNGRVGTYGCSNLGENQLVLAPARDPAHVAMIPKGAGGGVGTLGGWNTQFGAFDGGAFALSTQAGWFLDWGGEGRPLVEADVDRRALFQTLPVADMMRRAGVEDADWRRFATEAPGSVYWDSVGYLSDGDRFTTPGLHLNTWYDPTVAQTLHLIGLMRERAVPGSPGTEQFAVIGPWAHCQLEQAPDRGRLGELEIEGAAFPYWERYREWFDHWVSGERADSLAQRPRFTFFVLGENRWRTSDAWPPEGWAPEEWFLGPATGDQPPGSAGSLGRAAPTDTAALGFRYDPMDPVPARGGNACCTGLADDEPGPVDRRYLDDRRDVLRFVSPPLERDLTFAGPVDLFLEVASTAEDTDFTAHLVDVRPDGTALGLRDGILRMRYREGGARANFIAPGARYRIQIRLGDLAYRIPAGDRLRVDVSSSFFPRWDRNLNTQAPQGLGTDVRLADNTVFLGPDTGARLVIHRAPADTAPARR